MPESYKRWIRVGANLFGACALVLAGIGAKKAVDHFGLPWDERQTGQESTQPASEPDSRALPATNAPGRSGETIPSSRATTRVPASILPSRPSTAEKNPHLAVPGMPLAGSVVRHAPPTELLKSSQETIKGLATYEVVAGRLFDSAIETYRLPSISEQIGGRVTTGHPTKLRQVADAGFNGALSVFEPGDNVVADMTNTKQVSVYTSYFKYLSQQGVTSETLGRVVVMPQILSGEWQGARISDYAAVVSSQAETVRQVFPAAHVTTLVDIRELQASPEIMVQLSALKPGVIDSLTVQALSAGHDIPFHIGPNGALVADIESYLQPELIKRAVNSVRTSGANIPLTLVTNIGEARYTSGQRRAIAAGISRLVAALKAQNVNCTDVSLRLEDATDSSGVDYSFHDVSRGDPDKAGQTLAYLSEQLHQQGVTLTARVVA